MNGRWQLLIVAWVLVCAGVLLPVAAVRADKVNGKIMGPTNCNLLDKSGTVVIKVFDANDKLVTMTTAGTNGSYNLSWDASQLPANKTVSLQYYRNNVSKLTVPDVNGAAGVTETLDECVPN